MKEWQNSQTILKMKRRNEKMRELNGIEKHVERLYDEIRNISVSCSLAFGENGSPTVGIRKYTEGKNADCVIIDDIVWLIAGDAYTTSGKELKTLQDIRNTPTNEIVIHLRAQATVMCNIVQVTLGKHNVTSERNLSTERIVLNLE